MRLRIGRLRHRLTLQSPTETRTASGSVEKTWTTVASVWGAIEPLSGQEFLAISQTQNEVTVRLIIRHYSGLLPSWRVISGGRAYSIHAIINHDERDHVVSLMCSEGLAESEDIDVSENALLLESGDNLLLESGDMLLLE